MKEKYDFGEATIRKLQSRVSELEAAVRHHRDYFLLPADRNNVDGITRAHIANKQDHKLWEVIADD